jgi:hypothetical protein
MKNLFGVIFVLLLPRLFLAPAKCANSRDARGRPRARAHVPQPRRGDGTTAATEVVDTRLFDENGRLICTIYVGFFPALTEER